MQFIDLGKQQNIIRTKIMKRISHVLSHGKYIMGPEVSQLEEKLSDFVGVKYCITCSSGTDALLIPLIANNIGPGDSVLTSPFSYIATAEVIKLVGATPVFVDISLETFNMDPALIPSSISFAESQGLTPKAIIPINLFVLMLSLIISMYLGSNILSGTVVSGKIIKLLNGKIGIIFGKSSFFIISFNKFLKIYILINNFIIACTIRTCRGKKTTTYF